MNRPADADEITVSRTDLECVVTHLADQEQGVYWGVCCHGSLERLQSALIRDEQRQKGRRHSVNRPSSDACSRWRKTALRVLIRRHRAEFMLLCNSLKADGFTRDQARGRAMTILRVKYPSAYVALYDAVKSSEGNEFVRLLENDAPSGR